MATFDYQRAPDPLASERLRVAVARWAMVDRSWERKTVLAYEPGKNAGFRRVAVDVEAASVYVVSVDGIEVASFSRIDDAMARVHEIERGPRPRAQR
jgi:hypothetical protein